jgi:hypothetical protein
MQGGLTYQYGKLGVMKAIDNLIKTNMDWKRHSILVYFFQRYMFFERKW